MQPRPSPLDRDDVLVPSSFGVAPLMATAIVGGRHHFVGIIPLSQTVAVIVLVLLLLPERTPIPDCDSRSTRASYVVNNSQASIHARGLSSLSARHQGRSVLIHPLPPPAPRQHRRRDSRHVRRPLEVARVNTSVLPSFYALFVLFRVGITMILQPCCWRSDSRHPRLNPIPTGGTPQPPRGQIPPRPFRGGPQTRPQPLRKSRRRPQSSSLSSLSPSLPPLSSSSSLTGLPPRRCPRVSVDPSRTTLST
jgi:hypothetical protein